ncbi:MAG: hypothetical protein SF052_11475 [Bacteroidia bacterium]|nr:hypothetical protein [Bacteroidia bacterium]
MSINKIILQGFWLILIGGFGEGIMAQDTLMNNFPDKWRGEWSGELGIYKPTGKVQSLPMKLRISPSDSAEIWQWALIYEAAEPDVREYELIVIDREKGHFLIDEKNSVKLDAWLLGNVLSCRFSVDETLLLVNYIFEEDQIRFEIFAGSKTKINLTGEELEEVDEIYTYPVTTMQRATLRR